MENANRLQAKRVLRASQKRTTGRENVCSDKVDAGTGSGGDFHFRRMFEGKKRLQ